jgi:hypothetical protein
MSSRLIDGNYLLEGWGGGEMSERQPGTLRMVTSEDRYELNFATAHQFHLGDGHAEPVWLRFDDLDGRTLVRQEQGVQSVVTLLATGSGLDKAVE